MKQADLVEGLNQSQIQAVTHTHGPLLVLAGPGSGKTRVVTHRVAHLMQQGVSPNQIVALTFTNKAAREMSDRLASLVGDSQVWMGTFHGFCVRLLRRYARLVGLPENFSIYDVPDANAVLKSAVERASFELTHTSLGALSSRISYFKNRLVTPEILESEALSSEEHAVRQVYPHYQQELLKNGAVDFDDILLHTALLLRSNPELRQELDARFQQIIVDEYQDTNLAQYVIVRNLSVDAPNLMATGDPDQSIYSWRGANAKNVSNLERDYPDLVQVRLEENYRSTPQILSVADHLIQHNEYRKEKKLLANRANGPITRLVVYPTSRDEAENIAEDIETLVEQGAAYKDFAILYRTNAQSRSFEHALTRRHIPFQLIGGFRFYLRKEIKDLIAYVLLLNNPDDGVAFERAVNTPSRGVGKQTLKKIQEYALARGLPLFKASQDCIEAGLLSTRAAKGVRKFHEIMQQLSDLVHGPVQDLLQAAIDLTGYREYIDNHHRQSGDTDIHQNLDELLAEAYELDSVFGEQTLVGANDVSPLERFLETVALQSDTDRWNRGQDQVTLMTLHAAKGLEFPHVFIVAVEENILPHARSKEDPLELEEERRLFFVGITRAQDSLQISYARRRGFSDNESGIASSFLVELPRLDMEVVDKTVPEYGHFDGDFHADAFDTGSMGPSDHQGEWDEYCQVDDQLTQQDAQSGVTLDLDASQLPAEEMQARMRRTQKVKSFPGLVLGSQLAEPSQTDAEHVDATFSVGSWITHDRYGLGQIIGSQGQGKKRSVKIRFLTDDLQRTYRLDFVRLVPASPPG